MNIHDVDGKDCEISDRYNCDGFLTRLHFGFIYQAGISMNVNSMEEMFEFINVALSKIGKS